MNILIVHKNKNLNNKKNLINFIKKHNHNIDFIWKNKLNSEHIKDKNLIISIGGDGTFLSASHFITNQLILGVNLNHNTSEGALTSVKLHKLERKLKNIFNKKYKIKTYQREKVIIHQKQKCIKTEHALNETYIGNKNPHHPSNYIIKYRKKQEHQRSSGVLITTGTGSTAWYKAMKGKPYKRNKQELRFKIRELYTGRIYKQKMKKGRIKKQDKIEIISKMNHGILAIDSIRTYNIKEDDKITISLGLPLKVIQ